MRALCQHARGTPRLTRSAALRALTSGRRRASPRRTCCALRFLAQGELNTGEARVDLDAYAITPIVHQRRMRNRDPVFCVSKDIPEFVTICAKGWSEYAVHHSGRSASSRGLDDRAAQDIGFIAFFE
ncbi:hypothetical protein K438DRAFT_1992749 [Mycena galopus ATCC 62051]|nr:hypothetical protein K438DRAFT_1992749 [Mycena galopus ATCC 62051]